MAQTMAVVNTAGNLATFLQEAGNILDHLGNMRVRVDCDHSLGDARRIAVITKPSMSEDLSLHQSVSLGVDQALQQAITHHQNGQLQEAERLYHAILQIQPNHPDANHNLGVLAIQGKQPTSSLPYFRSALEAYPNQRQYLLSYIDALIQSGQVDIARQVVEQGRQRGLQGEEAETLAALCSENNPSPLEKDTLRSLFDAGRYAEAEDLAMAMTERYPLNRFGWKVLGAVFSQMGRNEDALAPMQKAAAISPNDAEVHSNLGTIFQNQCRLDESEICCQRALEIKPDYAEAHYHLGNTHMDTGRLDKAETSYRRALVIKPDYAEAHSNLGTIFQNVGRLGEAEVCCRRALEIKWDFAAAHLTLGNIAKDTGRLDGAEASYRRALEIEPDNAGAHSNLLFMFAYCGVISQVDYLEEARKREPLIISKAMRESSRLRQFSVLPREGRRLRIGYISGDYRQHPVSCYVEELFRYHDRSRAEVFAYSNNAIRDRITERLDKLADHWESIVGVSDEVVCQRIEAAKIDVLVDLSGHTAFNRLKVFACRTAPIQAHYLGYFASTGITEIDYWIGDSILLPESEDGLYSETIWRLPRVWVSYLGRDDAPISRWRPTEDGTVWLGSFNNLNKITTETVALWAIVLHALPEGRLLLKTKGLGETVNRQRIESAFATYGIVQERLELAGSTADWMSHMALYDRLDIALDPIGSVGGGTTTCDAMWMGVPVITLSGQSMGKRMTASMLSAIGHSEWIAESKIDYVAKVVAMARDVVHRDSLRFKQREKMRNSPLCDAVGLARALEDAYEEMFDKWWQGNVTSQSYDRNTDIIKTKPC